MTKVNVDLHSVLEQMMFETPEDAERILHTYFPEYELEQVNETLWVVVDESDDVICKIQSATVQ